MGWRRRYCPSPVFVVLAVGVCIFYQSLILFWRRAPWKFEEYTPGTKVVFVNEHQNDMGCVFALVRLYRRMKELEDTIRFSLNSSSSKNIFLYVHPSLDINEHAFYRTILRQLGYVVILTDIKGDEGGEGLVSNKETFIYIPPQKSLESDCSEKQDFLKLNKLKKVNMLLKVQQLLCHKEELCKKMDKYQELETLTVCLSHLPHSVIKRKFTSPFFPSKSKRKLNDTATVSKNPIFKGPVSGHHFESQDLPFIRMYVLITSVSPLRAFLHSTGIVQHQPHQQFVPIKLRVFYEQFFKWNSPSQAFETMKETVGKFLLVFPKWNEASFVKDHFHFDGLHTENNETKDEIIKDTFKFILQNVSISFVEILYNLMEFSAAKKHICGNNPTVEEVMWEKIHMFLSYAQENLEAFEMIPPSDNLESLKYNVNIETDTKIDLGLVPKIHKHLSRILQDFRLLITRTSSFNLTVGESYRKPDDKELPVSSGNSYNLKAHTKQMNCSNDDSTLCYISYIYSHPKLELNPDFNPEIKNYYVEVPFDVVTVEIGAEATHCKSQVQLEKDGQRVATYPLGLGNNEITIYVMDKLKPTPGVLRKYHITIHREDRPSLPLFNQYTMCGFVQDCGLIINQEEPCGLHPVSLQVTKTHQRYCESGDAKGQWIVPCLSCEDNRTCDWRAITWYTYTCHHAILLESELQHCMQQRKLLFIGDSTNRGIMHYLIERVNKTLQEWQKSHAMKFYNINNGTTAIGYSYYPQFWIEASHRPTFENALVQLIKRSQPLKDTKQTVLVVGGVQWLNSKHLQIIEKVLKRENLSHIMVIIKSIGMGFHLPVHGVRSLSPNEVKYLYVENLQILNASKLYGYEVVDTLSITMGRYKEFLQGKCGCHYHKVVKSSLSKEEYQRNTNLLNGYRFGDIIFPLFQDHPSNMKSPYHVHGSVNQVYSEILLSRICAKKEKY
ncbi:hypothetical protein GDO86_005839 [Hymenochirus boettgeri]|uniref:Cadherin-like beta-sandwich-like domain-containing protein n=1 Tax=Hymenochirus boettgeri TaxID=247094 RepID=A0A8T2J7W1_9PIPI|nr:hypothetical protein GDO86_005839 [Hymenochirus boettgeri]